MKILITGAAGYIGSKLIDYFSSYEHDHQILGIDNFNYGQYYLASYLTSKYPIERYDIRQDGWLKDIQNYDVIIHLAALVGAPICDRAGSSITYEVNQGPVERLVKVLSPNQRLIFPNTNSLYGASKDTICTEKSVGNPVSSYAITKQKAEEVVLQHPNSVSLRLSTVFGLSPRMRMDLLVNDFCYKARFDNLIKLYQGNFRRNYIHIEDVCSAIHWASVGRGLEYEQEAFNVGNEAMNCTKLQLAQEISKQIPCKIEEREGTDRDQRDYFVSSSKLYNPHNRITAQRSLSDGISELNTFFDALPVSPYMRQSLMKYMSNV